MPLEGTASGPIASRVTPGSTRPAPILTSRSQTSQSPCSQVTSESKPVSFAYPTTGRRIPVRPAAGLTELARHEQVAYTVPSRRSPKRTSVSLMTSMVMAQQMSEKVATPSQAKTWRAIHTRTSRVRTTKAENRATTCWAPSPIVLPSRASRPGRRPRPASARRPRAASRSPPAPSVARARLLVPPAGTMRAARSSAGDRWAPRGVRPVIVAVRGRCAFVPRSSRVRSSLPLRVPASRLRRHPGHVRGGKAWVRCERMRGVGTGVRGGAVRSTW